jgi:dTDP-4-amino-4,6-dideoxygalactose transaminase
LDERQALIAHLKGRGINTVFHYVALHLSGMGRRFGGKEGQCPVTEHASDCLVRLPFFKDLTPDDQAKVVHAIKEFKTR